MNEKPAAGTPEPAQEPQAWLQIQVMQKQKTAWVRAAQAKGMRLAAWVTKALDEAAVSNK
jgi:predicted HicB family RNase H-like nuclease